MWISIKDLASAVGKTPRAIQIRVKKDKSINTRQKDGKTLELYVPSLPADWQTEVARKGLLNVNQQSLNTLVPSAQLAVPSVASISGLGSKLTESQRRRMAIASKLQQRPVGTQKMRWVSSVARSYGVSVSTARRIACEIEDHGTIEKLRNSGRYTKWDPEASGYLKAFFLQALAEHGACARSTAWLACQKEASEKGWQIGSRTSAYNLLKEIHPLLIEKALGGRRALDNYFYIARNSGLLAPMQVVIGDQHIFDFWVADYETGRIWRPECYLWLDMHTKLLYGIAFADNHYNSDTVRDALRMGLYRFGKPDCTYNDNGSSECSKAITEMVDDLLRFGVQARDYSDLYKTSDGTYVVLDKAEEKAVDIAGSENEWRAKHRRIYANVKNAKTKDIERFFRTIEERLDGRLIPGRCATPGAAAAIDEIERARLDRQKEKHELLTMEQFVRVVIEELQTYENTRHSTLKMSPRQQLETDIAKGFDLDGRRFKNSMDIEIITASRKKCRVQRGRVLVDNIWYQGAELEAGNDDLLDVGLYRKDGEKVEVRFSEYDRNFCFAIVDGEARKLLPVKKIPMLDNTLMIEALQTKNRQIRAVSDVFNAMTKKIGSVMYKPPEQEKVRKVEPEESGVSKEVVKRPALPFLPLHPTRQARYKWCLDMLIARHELPKKDMEWLHDYRHSEEYQEYIAYWTNYEQQLEEGII
ncbi:transposase domain-containing protein [uncultured Sphaerochaeta sp.]|uniref:transposase domain-containing protein n=1 Tax=uncultured Sphaerochaeta sp. TaxID=886478 RepID=UPI002A0A2CA5|nr:transposase domain-containing protein [uncultured Sphaerochaeta sp.]